MNIIIEIKPSADLLLAISELTGAIRAHAAALDRLAAAPQKPTHHVSVAETIADGPIAAQTPREPGARPIKRRTRPVTVWTPERLAILERDYPAGVPRDVIMAALNALPGEPIKSVLAFKARVKYSGLQRTGAVRIPCSDPEPTEAPEPLPACPVASPVPDRLATEPPVMVPAEPFPRAPRLETIHSAPVNSTPVRMNGEQIRRWASERGVLLNLPLRQEDIDACQAKARAIGHPGIEFTGMVR